MERKSFNMHLTGETPTKSCNGWMWSFSRCLFSV